MTDLATWLEQRGLGKYAQLFAAHKVDLEVLSDLTEEDLDRLGLPLGPRKKLLKAAKSLRAPDADRAAQLAETRAGADGERRQLIVLFCDMVGFTELASRLDPEVLQGIVRRYEDTCAVCITRYEGYVFQRLGDGIVAFFGYPLADEGEAERAIRAGLRIVAALATRDIPGAGHLQVRIGIATGLVVVSSAEPGAVGETMNLAARLQAIAPETPSR